MPKRSRKVSNSGDNNKQRKFEKLQEEMDRIQREIELYDSESDSDAYVRPNPVITTAEIHTPEQPVLVMEEHIGELHNPDGTDDVASDKTILDLFGVDPNNRSAGGNVILDGIANRWSNIIQGGLLLEDKNSLIEKYVPAENCSALIPPKINEEIANALKDHKIREYKFLIKLQEQISAGLMALYRPINLSISGKSDSYTLEHLADAAKLFSDTFYQISLHRRFLLNPQLNPQFKKCLEGQQINTYLYGENLMEKVKQVQASRSTTYQVQRTILKQKVTSQTIQPQRRHVPPEQHQQQQQQQHLNFRSQYYRPKFKPRENLEGRTMERRVERQAPPKHPKKWYKYQR